MGEFIQLSMRIQSKSIKHLPPKRLNGVGWVGYNRTNNEASIAQILKRLLQLPVARIMKHLFQSPVVFICVTKEVTRRVRW